MVEPWGFMSCYETTVLVLEIEHGRPGLGANIFCTCAGGGRGFLKLKTYLPWKLLGIVDFTKSLWVLLHRSHFPSCSQVILHQPHWTLIIGILCDCAHRFLWPGGIRFHLGQECQNCWFQVWSHQTTARGTKRLAAKVMSHDVFVCTKLKYWMCRNVC